MEPIKKNRSLTYNAPVLQSNSIPQGNRCRFSKDIISECDKGAKSFDKTFNPVSAHSYKDLPTGYASNTIDTKTGNQILIE